MGTSESSVSTILKPFECYHILKLQLVHHVVKLAVMRGVSVP